MISVKPFVGILESTAAYRYLQMPFAKAKLRPVFRHNDLSGVRRVLDIGCGPGTNAAHFRNVNYLGLDINAGYVDYAKRRFGDRFLVADARTYRPPQGEFDLILLNSFLHHIDDQNAESILKALSPALGDDGFVHILDLVLPEDTGVARWMAINDRGNHPRPIEEWRRMFTAVFDEVVFEPYLVSLVGIPFLRMVYFKGARRPLRR